MEEGANLTGGGAGRIDHTAVMAREAVDAVMAALEAPAPRDAGDGRDDVDVVVDATFGGGGHSRMLLARMAQLSSSVDLTNDASSVDASSGRATSSVAASDKESLSTTRDISTLSDVHSTSGAPAAKPPSNRVTRRLVALDCDEAAALRAVEITDDRFIFCRRNYAELAAVLDELGIASARAVLFDLGVSSMQLDDMARGFSLHSESAPDMRMDRRVGGGLGEWLSAADEATVARALREYGEEPEARRVARRLVARRAEIGSCRQLADEVRAAKRRGGKVGIHPATQVFQALRIAVNDELEMLRVGLAAAVRALAVGGRLVVIAFHSLEDRIVKRLAGGVALPGIGLVRRSVLAPVGKMRRPGAAETAANPRARSARLRVFEKTAAAGVV